jgi:hypothetical protein
VGAALPAGRDKTPTPTPTPTHNTCESRVSNAPITAALCSRSISYNRKGATPEPPPAPEPKDDRAESAPPLPPAPPSEEEKRAGPVSGRRPYSFLLTENGRVGRRGASQVCKLMLLCVLYRCMHDCGQRGGGGVKRLLCLLEREDGAALGVRGEEAQGPGRVDSQGHVASELFVGCMCTCPCKRGEGVCMGGKGWEMRPGDGMIDLPPHGPSTQPRTLGSTYPKRPTPAAALPLRQQEPALGQGHGDGAARPQHRGGRGPGTCGRRGRCGCQPPCVVVVGEAAFALGEEGQGLECREGVGHQRAVHEAEERVPLRHGLQRGDGAFFLVVRWVVGGEWLGWIGKGRWVGGWMKAMNRRIDGFTLL